MIYTMQKLYRWNNTNPAKIGGERMCSRRATSTLTHKRYICHKSDNHTESKVLSVTLILTVKQLSNLCFTYSLQNKS